MTRRAHRRIRTEPVPGADPEPARIPAHDGLPAETRTDSADSDRPSSWGDRESEPETDNDRRLRDDVPPHSVDHGDG